MPALVRMVRLVITLLKIGCCNRLLTIISMYVILYDMKESWLLSGVGPRAVRLRYRHAHAPHPTTVSPVLTVADVCGRLHKSRRQVYRYLRAGRLQPCAQVLGQWLFAPSEVEREARCRLPRAFKRFFWDARIASLSVDHHREYILGRLLEFGDRAALRWVVQAYPRAAVVAFLKGRGADVLSQRAWQFWALYVGLRGPQQRYRSWRSRASVWMR